MELDFATGAIAIGIVILIIAGSTYSSVPKDVTEEKCNSYVGDIAKTISGEVKQNCETLKKQ